MMKKILKWGGMAAILAVILTSAACIDKSKWRPKDYDRPPSWENDYGRPDRDW